MKKSASSALLSILSIGILNLNLSTAHAQGTAFTYQGRLNSDGIPANGLYDFRFRLAVDPLANSYFGSAYLTNGISVSNGLFGTAIDFGPGIFTGSSYWLEVDVRTNGAGSYTTLTPLQPLTPVPYAINAARLLGGFTVQNNTNGGPNVIGGSQVNSVAGGVIGATIAGGGATNFAKSAYTNKVTASFGTVSGGGGNTASGLFAAVGGGIFNMASQESATVGGGVNNTASGAYSTVTGGEGGTASGFNATVDGGYVNVAAGNNSFAAGMRAQALHDGSFVWADAQNSVGGNGVPFASTTENQFAVRASGGVLFAADVQIGTGAGDYHHLTLGGGNSEGFVFGSYPYFGDGVHLGYNFYADANGSPHVINSGGGSSRISAQYGQVQLAVGNAGFGPNTVRLTADTSGVTVNGTFNNSSDRNAKQDFMPVSSLQILDKVLRLPVSEWSYKEDAATRHIGPMGQDFYSIFNIGTDEKHIAPIDEGGVALAAIQGLNQKLEETRAENAELKLRLARLEQIITKQKSN